MTDAGHVPDGGFRAAVVITGDELLRGFITEGNARHIATGLRAIGIPLEGVRLVGDGRDRIEAAIAHARELTDRGLVIVTGGLGPTHDDRTSEAVAASAGLDLEVRPEAVERIESRLRSMGRLETDADRELFDAGNRKQATVPVGSTLLDPSGTAPGYVCRGVDGTVYVVLPGPPGELRHAWAQAITHPSVVAIASRSIDEHERVIRIWGHPESTAVQVLDDLGHVDSAARTVTLCARDGELELSIRGTDAAAVDELVDGLLDAFGGSVFARDDERPVEEIVLAGLATRAWTIATAESCTGGMLGELLTAAPGASAQVRGGLVVYSNDAKVELAGVEQDLLDERGAVSEPVARALAEGARERLGADVGVGITGVAGPGGGTTDKPVGTVFVAVADPSGTAVGALRLPGDREAVRRRSCMAALHVVRQRLASEDAGAG